MMVPNNLHNQLLNSFYDQDEFLLERQPEKKRKQVHKASEQKGRQRINNQINDLKNLLPECANVVTTKAFILERAVDSLKRLQDAILHMQSYNRKMQKENSILAGECEKVRGKVTNPFSATIKKRKMEENTLPAYPSSLTNSPCLSASQELFPQLKTEPFEFPPEFLDANVSLNSEFIDLDSYNLDSYNFASLNSNPFLASSQESTTNSSISQEPQSLNFGSNFEGFSMEDPLSNYSFSKFQFDDQCESFSPLLG